MISRKLIVLEFGRDIGRELDMFASREESGDVIGNLGGKLTESVLGRVVGRGEGCDFVLLGFVGRMEVLFFALNIAVEVVYREV